MRRGDPPSSDSLSQLEKLVTRHNFGASTHTKNNSGRGFAPNPTGELTALPHTPLAGGEGGWIHPCSGGQRSNVYITEGRGEGINIDAGVLESVLRYI